MLDTEELSLSLKENEKRNETRGKMDRKINLLINFPPRRVYYSNKHITPRNSINNIQQSSNLQRFIRGNENNTYENTYIEEKNDKINIKYKRNHYVKKKKNVYNIKMYIIFIKVIIMIKENMKKEIILIMIKNQI